MILVVLISGCAVEIENNIESALRAFGNDPVETAEIPFAVFVKDFCALVVIVKVAEPERNAYAVEAEFDYLVEVVFGYPVVLVDVDELIRFSTPKRSVRVLRVEILSSEFSMGVIQDSWISHVPRLTPRRITSSPRLL